MAGSGGGAWNKGSGGPEIKLATYYNHVTINWSFEQTAWNQRLCKILEVSGPHVLQGRVWVRRWFANTWDQVHVSATAGSPHKLQSIRHAKSSQCAYIHMSKGIGIYRCQIYIYCLHVPFFFTSCTVRAQDHTKLFDQFTCCQSQRGYGTIPFWTLYGFWQGQHGLDCGLNTQITIENTAQQNGINCYAQKKKLFSKTHA